MFRPPALVLSSLLLSCSPAPPVEPPAPGAAAHSTRGAIAPSRSSSQEKPSRSGGAVSRALESITPRGPGCQTRPSRPPGDRIAAAAAAFDQGSYTVALTCAEEALHHDPRSVPALHYRAAALAALDRLDEARVAYSRALAVDPDDPETLWSAADFQVLRLGDREALQVGLAHALRGARLALTQARPDRDLAGRLLLLAGMAENDLGQSREALRYLGKALAILPGDPDAIYERSVALYELCRFGEARLAFQTVLRKVPGDAWAFHYLGLVAERSGDDSRARTLLARAVGLAPGKIQPEVDIDREAFEEEVRRAISALPAEEKRSLGSVPVQIEELPAIADLTAVSPPLSPSILGLYRGPPESEPCTPAEGPRCRSIVLYRRNLARFAQDRRALAEQVRMTLLHELGHLHGEDDDQLRDRGLE